MNQSDEPHRQPDATPVGHSGSRVEIHERPAWAISGWAGVLVVLLCVAAIIFLVESSIAAVAIAPALAALVVSTSLVIVQPGQTKVVRFFGSNAVVAPAHASSKAPWGWLSWPSRD